MALRDMTSIREHTTETAINLRPSPTKRGFYVLCLFDSHFTIQLPAWQMPVTSSRVGTSRQTARGGTTVWNLFGARSCQETFRATRTMRRDESHETHRPILHFIEAARGLQSMRLMPSASAARSGHVVVVALLCHPYGLLKTPVALSLIRIRVHHTIDRPVQNVWCPATNCSQQNAGLSISDCYLSASTADKGLYMYLFLY